MEYVTVFDIAQTGYRLWFLPAIGGAFILAGLGILLLVQGRVFFRLFFLLFAFGWTTIVTLGTYGEYSTLLAARNSGNYSMVEGQVENFDPMPFEGHREESFSVNGIRFSYSDYLLSAAFNTSASHGGPIRAGAHVRISYVEDKIIRLEIQKDDLRQ